MATSSAKSAKTGQARARNPVAKVTVAELRSNFKAVEAKLARGVQVQVTRRGTVVAEMKAPVEEESKPAAAGSWRERAPDFMARLREIWGDTPLDIDTTALVSEGRDRDLS